MLSHLELNQRHSKLQIDFGNLCTFGHCRYPSIGTWLNGNRSCYTSQTAYVKIALNMLHMLILYVYLLSTFPFINTVLFMSFYIAY